MHPPRTRRALALLLLSALGWAPLAEARRQAGARVFSVTAGPNVNHFVQSPHLSMHTVVRTNDAPRILFATSAGNSGVGLWFRPLAAGHGLQVAGDAHPVEHAGMHGVALSVRGPERLDLDTVLLDSVRALRDHDHGARGTRDATVRELLELLRSEAGRRAGATPALIAQVEAWLRPTRVLDPARPEAIVFERRALGSDARYRVEIVPEGGTRVDEKHGAIALVGAGGTRFSVRSFIDRPPLEPLAQVLRPGAGDARQERNLKMLVYKQKLVAGSYQYLTYFGRDAAISARLLGERLKPEVVGIAVGSMLDRVSPEGRFAHEESIGDQATLEALPRLMKAIRRGRVRLTPQVLARLERPIYDYKMMDGEFLLPPLLVDFLMRATPTEVAAALTPARLEALGRVVARVLEQTERFAGQGTAELVHLRRGQIVGNWRDSGEGLGHGKTPLDVNAYLVPAALRAVEQVLAHPSFPRAAFLSGLGARRPEAARLLRSPGALARRQASWRDAGKRFEVALDGKTARARLRAYLATFPADERRVLEQARLWSGVTVGEALAGSAAAELDAGVRFPGISLDHRGRPTPVLSSDETFHFFYGEPSREALIARVRQLFQPFPLGLMTPTGMVVANPGYSDRPGDHALFDRDHYHGAVVWSWQQTMMKLGLARQLGRFAGDAEVKHVVGRALAQLDEVERNVGDMKASELWSWRIVDGKYVAQPFGAAASHKTEGTALQLWSNTY